MVQFAWSPGIGDPTVGGWITVALYFVAAVSSSLTLRAVVSRREAALWRGIFLLLVALGINKQLDLQSALTELGRVLASQEGWYGQRQLVQIWFIVGVAVCCVALALLLIVLARKAPPATWLAIAGVTIVLAFVLIRASSFHHIDRFIGERILGINWNWMLEMGGISIVLFASELRRRVS